MAIEDDLRLVVRMLAGDAGAVDDFISEYQQFIYAILIRYLNLSPEDSEEVFQRLLFHIWEDDFRRLRDWRGETNLSAYLARIIRNLAHDYRREHRFETQDTPDIPIDDFRLANIERKETIGRALSKLSARDRELIERRYLLDQSLPDIADALETTTNNVGVALTRAKRRLRKILKGM